MYKRPETRTVTISSGGTTSDAIGIGDYVLGAILTPAALTSTSLTFLAAEAQGGTYRAVYDSDGNQLTATLAASRAIALTGVEADAFAPFQWVKLVMGSAEAAERTLTLALK
jgi:hypothetical protein